MTTNEMIRKICPGLNDAFPSHIDIRCLIVPGNPQCPPPLPPNHYATEFTAIFQHVKLFSWVVYFQEPKVEIATIIPQHLQGKGVG
jgi:hypothetical protein